MIGASPVFGWRGITIDQPHLCIDGAIALLRVLKDVDYKPRVIVTSSMGIGSDHANLPFVMRVSCLFCRSSFVRKAYGRHYTKPSSISHIKIKQD
jgi:hypothetical protein